MSQPLTLRAAIEFFAYKHPTEVKNRKIVAIYMKRVGWELVKRKQITADKAIRLIAILMDEFCPEAS